MTSRTFEFRFDPVSLPLRLLGISPSRSRVVVDDTHLDVRFGPWSCRTPLDNVRDVRITRDYSVHRAIGPRGSMVDNGATFGSSTDGGVCICFRRRVAALTPLAVHPALTVTVADLEGLAEHLRARCAL